MSWMVSGTGRNSGGNKSQKKNNNKGGGVHFASRMIKKMNEFSPIFENQMKRSDRNTTTPSTTTISTKTITLTSKNFPATNNNKRQKFNGNARQHDMDPIALFFDYRRKNTAVVIDLTYEYLPAPHFEYLPTEIVLHLGAFLDLLTLLSFASVNHNW